MNCFGDKHLKDQDLYCNECCVKVCSKCFKTHKDHAEKIVDIDQVLDKTVNSLDDITVFIKENNSTKVSMDDNFQKEVEVEYQDENSKITEYFKKLHDHLHYKEVDLKRELKSNYDENCEVFTQKASIIENNVTQSQQILKLITENSGDNDVLLKKFNEFKLLSDRQKKIIEKLLFKSMKFHDYKFEHFEEFMNRNAIKPPSHVDQGQMRYIYFYQNDLQRFDMKTKKFEKIETKAPEKRPESIWQSMAATSTHLYIFCRTNYWKYVPETKTWIVKELPDKTDLGGYQPAFFDGKSHIYLFGGYKDNTFFLNVTRFDIVNETFEFNFAKLNSSHQNNPFIINGDESKIYLVGGYHHKDTDTLDLLDVETRTVKTLDTFRDKGFPNLTTGVYVPQCNAIFMITREYLFMKYDLETKTCVPLSNPTGNGYYNRIFFDGENTMFLTSTKLRSFLEYNIALNTWTTLMDFSPSSSYGSAQASF